MKKAPLPKNEKQRLQALRRYDILDSDFEQIYDEITQLAATTCDSPIALISFIDSDRQWFKAKVGLDARETHRDLAFCAHAILNRDDVLVVEDTYLDERFVDNPLVTENPPSIRFYAGAPLITPDGYPLGTLCAIDSSPKSITDQQLNSLKILAKQVMAQLELRLAYKKLQDSSRELQELNNSKDKFLAIIAHDLRSPFNTILNFAEMLKNDLDNLDREILIDLATSIYDSSETAFKLVNNLLAWSMVESGKMKINTETIDIQQLINECITLVVDKAKNKDITIKFETVDSLLVESDRNMLMSTMQNLIANGIKFTQPQGNVKIKVFKQGKFAQVDVTDDGVGMTEKQIEKLFNLTDYQSTEGTQGEVGTGLGLLLCQEFIRKNGGQIWARSLPNQGSIFSFTIPGICQ